MAIKRVWNGWTTRENAGDYERCYVPAVAQEVLARWDLRSSHYLLVEERDYG